MEKIGLFKIWRNMFIKLVALSFVTSLSSHAATAQAEKKYAAFRDVTEKVLPPYTQAAPPFLDTKKTPMAAGACVFDVDNDGDQDIYFVSGQGYPNALMVNIGGVIFENQSELWGLEYSDNSALSCMAADLDNDGCEDLVLTGAYTGASFTGNLMLRNTYCDGGGVKGFVDVTPDILRQWPYSVSSTAADIDNDGLLDLFVSSLPELDLSNFPGPAPIEAFPGDSLLLRNMGDLKFEDITAGSGVAHPTCPCMTVFLDYDEDGFLDLLAINCGNDLVRTFDMQLYKNNGGDGTFTDVGAETGLSGPNAPKGMWMGAGIGDFNSDGCLDVASTNLATDYLFEDADPKIMLGQCSENNNNDTTGFVAVDVDIVPEEGVIDSTIFAWGPIARDFNNDGRLDMYWSGTYIPPQLVPDSTATKNNGSRNRRSMQEGWFALYSPGEVLYGLDPQQSNHSFESLNFKEMDLANDFHLCMTSGDFNRDGAVDILVPTDDAGTILNNTREGRPALMYGIPNGNNWLGIRLKGTAKNVNPQAIGAVVRFYKKDETSTFPKQTLLLSTSSAAMTTEEKTLYFGAGKEDLSDFQAIVTWPGGSGVEVFDGFMESGVVTLVQGLGLGIGVPQVDGNLGDEVQTIPEVEKKDVVDPATLTNSASDGTSDASKNRLSHFALGVSVALWWGS